MNNNKPIFAGIRTPHGIILQPIPAPTWWQRLAAWLMRVVWRGAVWFVIWLFGYLVGFVVGAG